MEKKVSIYSEKYTTLLYNNTVKYKFIQIHNVYNNNKNDEFSFYILNQGFPLEIILFCTIILTQFRQK